MTTEAITRATACALDCPDSCSLDVTVEGDQLLRIDGNKRNPLTDGFICSKVKDFARHVYSEHRILQPARRRGPKGSGDFEPISWDAALTLVSERLRQTAATSGGEAILPFSYGGSNGHFSQDSTDARLFRRLGASRLEKTVCAAPSSRAATGLYGKFPGMAPEDFEHSRLIIVWGANPSVSSIHLVPIIRRAQKAGAKLVVIDPRTTALAKQADLHLAPLPGGDLPIALGMIRWLFEHQGADLDFLQQHATGVDELRQRCQSWTLERAAEVSGVEAGDLEQLAKLYAETSPAAIRCGWGSERNRNGGSATAAILALPAVGGKFGQRGGGYMMSNSSAWPLDAATVDGEAEAATRSLNMNRLGRHLLGAEPTIEMLFVYNANPLTTLPEQGLVRAGLERQDLFTVVFEQVMTDTARYADLILPATTFLEHRDLRHGYGTMALQPIEPMIPALGEARSNFDVFSELCQRLGLEDEGDARTMEEFEQRLMKQSFNGQSARLRRELEDEAITYPASGQTPVQFVDTMPWTEDGKIHLLPSDLDAEAAEGLYTYRPQQGSDAYPLIMLSAAIRRTVSSTFGQLHRNMADLEMHPDDAAARGLAKGDQVRIWNDLGEVICNLRLTKTLRPGVVQLPKGLWSHNTANGNTSNMLVDASYTDLGDGACFNDARVEVAKLVSP